MEVDRQETCSWVPDEYHSTWEAECGGAFMLEDGAPSDNNMAYCPFCGKPLVEELGGD